MIIIEAKKYGMQEMQQMLAAAPGAFVKATRTWMTQEKRRYVGSKRYEGKFQRQLARKKRGAKGAAGRDGKWPKNIYKAFKGYLIGGDRIDGMAMRMGFGLQNPTKFAMGLRMMDQATLGSRTISSKGKLMPIPMYRNIAKLGLKGAMSDVFRMLALKSLLFPVKKGGKIYWFDKGNTYKAGPKKGKFKASSLLFVGARGVTEKPQFDFTHMLEADRPVMINRYRNTIDSTIRRLNRGTIRKNDFKPQQ